MRKFKAKDWQVIMGALEILDDATSVTDDYVEARSEQWLEGDAAGEYQEWQGNIEDARDALSELTETPGA